MLLPRPLLVALAAAALSVLLPTPRAAAQDAGRSGEPDPGALQARFEVWRGARPEWRLVREPRTGFAELVYGGRARPAFRPESDAEYADVARLFAADAAGLIGIDPGTLLAERVHFLSLAAIGTSDKMAVRFEQRVAGVPVLDGAVHVLMDLEGHLLALQSTALPGLSGLATDPGIGAGAARERALELFTDATGLGGALRVAPRLGVARHEVGGRFVPALVWEVDVQWHQPGVEPEGRLLWIDARDGALLRSAPSIHHLDVGGTVVTNATPGEHPDTPTNPPALMSVPYVRVSSAAGTVYTDQNGAFLYPGASGPLDVTVSFRGDFAIVDNLLGDDHFVVQTIDGTANVVTMNPAPQEFVTAQANAFVRIGQLRDWVRSVDPLDDTADFTALAEVNKTAGCNAVFDGDSVIFHRANLSLGCPNTAFSTIIAHEMGHWLNERYQTRNGLDGMGEGNADIWAMYSYDTPIVGQGMLGPGTIVRSGDNTRLFCGDCCPSCHGPIPHDNGEVWMGAAWKIRQRLNATHGNDLGDLAADSLFLAWMNAYDQLEIKSVIEAQWLVLDDDDGYVLNGTPHFADIDQGFRDQGFPGVDLDPIFIEDVTQLGDTLDELGPYLVEASITAHASPPLAEASLVWRVNGGAWSTTSMSAAGGGLHAASIPGQSAVSLVEYYVTATDSAGTQVERPAGAPAESFRFHVGMFERFFDDFEGGTNGWSSGGFGDTSNDNEDFQHGLPHGKSGDPAAAFSGSYVRGNNLGAGNWSGKYESNQHNWLRTPEIDCSSANGTRLRFRRWLDVQASTGDQARLALNGVQVFVNAPHVDTGDGAWIWFDYDVSALADGQPAVQVEFSLQSDTLDNRAGWTIDDVQLVSMGASGGCIPPTGYGLAKTNSLGAEPELGWAGSPSRAAGDLHLTLAGGIPDELAFLFSGATPDNTPFFGGFRLVKPPLTREALLALDPSGGFSIPVAITPEMVGTSRYYQAWYRDPAHPDGTGVGLSGALAVVFCD